MSLHLPGKISLQKLNQYNLPSRELTYPTLGKGKSSSNMPYQGDMLISWRVTIPKDPPKSGWVLNGWELSWGAIFSAKPLWLLKHHPLEGRSLEAL